MEERTWREDGICWDSPMPEIWFEPDLFDAARRLCNECPVQYECISFAIQTRQPEGVWGGYSFSSYRKIRRVPEEIRQRHLQIRR